MDRWVESPEERWTADQIYRWIPMDQAGVLWITKGVPYYLESENTCYRFITDEQLYQYDTEKLRYLFYTDKKKQIEG
jgi:hypothetical protein